MGARILNDQKKLFESDTIKIPVSESKYVIYILHPQIIQSIYNPKLLNTILHSIFNSFAIYNIIHVFDFGLKYQPRPPSARISFGGPEYSFFGSDRVVEYFVNWLKLIYFYVYIQKFPDAIKFLKKKDKNILDKLKDVLLKKSSFSVLDNLFTCTKRGYVCEEVKKFQRKLNLLIQDDIFNYLLRSSFFKENFLSLLQALKKNELIEDAIEDYFEEVLFKGPLFIVSLKISPKSIDMKQYMNVLDISGDIINIVAKKKGRRTYNFTKDFIEFFAELLTKKDLKSRSTADKKYIIVENELISLIETFKNQLKHIFTTVYNTSSAKEKENLVFSLSTLYMKLNQWLITFKKIISRFQDSLDEISLGQVIQYFLKTKIID